MVETKNAGWVGVWGEKEDPNGLVPSGSWRMTVERAFEVMRPTVTLELGLGEYSTPYFLGKDMPTHVGIEAIASWYRQFAQERQGYTFINTWGAHERRFIPLLDYEIALVDGQTHTRGSCVGRLMDMNIKLIVAHDSVGEQYGYDIFRDPEQRWVEGGWHWLEDMRWPRTLLFSRDRSLLQEIEKGVSCQTRSG